MFKRLTEDIHQLSRRMHVSGICHSSALDSGLAFLQRHPVAVYLKCEFAVFVILFGLRSALVFAVHLPAISRLAKNKR